MKQGDGFLAGKLEQATGDFAPNHVGTPVFVIPLVNQLDDIDFFEVFLENGIYGRVREVDVMGFLDDREILDRVTAGALP